MRIIMWCDSKIYKDTTWNQIGKKNAGSSVEPVKQSKVNGIMWYITSTKSAVGIDRETCTAWIFKSIFSIQCN